MNNTPTTPTNVLNDPKKNYNQGHNQFPMSYDVATTMAYGYLTPHFVFNAVEGDTVPLNSRHKLMSPTLASPLMSKFVMNKDYFNVPMRAILPRTWELIYANPVQGDDVPADANCIFSLNRFFVFANFLKTSTGTVDATNFTELCKAVLAGETFYSHGSLMTRLGYNLASGLRINKGNGQIGDAFESQPGTDMSYDEWFENYFIPFFRHYAPIIVVNNQNYMLKLDETPSHYVGVSGVPVITLHSMLELMRDNPDFIVNVVTDDVKDVSELIINEDAWQFANSNSEDGFVNFDRAVAYQLAYAQFFTNDHVDFVFTAEMYRNSMQTLYNMARWNDDASDPLVTVPAFEYNGTSYLYDVFSRKVVEDVLNEWSRYSLNNYPMIDKMTAMYGFIQNLFGLRKSLRYGDYFTGARVEPLAVGDVEAQVMDGAVSAVDVTRSILMQRFLNAVNRTGQKFKDYIKMLSGRDIAPDQHEPHYLSHTSTVIGGMEIENTAGDQGNIVTLLRSNDGNFAFSVDITEPSIIIGVTSFSAKRLYSMASDRFMFHKDRFDMFNKFMQYQGDQDIQLREKSLWTYWLLGETDAESPFAYTGRFMEYKQRNSIANGAFVDFLPSWAFVTDNDESDTYHPRHQVLTPAYIRANSAEFNRFVKSNVFYSLAGYYHFITYIENDCNASRPMDFNPTIL